MKVFEFAYSDCIHESGYVTMSIHKTRKGAEMALDHHKNDAYKEWLEMYTPSERWLRKFGSMENWIIKETELKE